MRLALVILVLAAIAAADILVVDNTQPAVIIDNPTTVLPVYTLENHTVNVRFNFTEQNPSNYSITIFNTSIVVCSKYTNLTSGGTNITINDTCTLSGARNNYNFSIRVNLTDVVGNTSSNTQSNAVILDTVAPVITAESPANNSEISSSTVAFSVNTSETAECRYAPTSAAAFDEMTTFANTNSTTHSVVLILSEFGAYNFYVRCQDPSLNRMNSDYFTRFHYAGSPAYFGRSVEMSFGLKIGGNKSDDTVKRSSAYALSYDIANGTVFAILYSGSSAFASAENRTYTPTDYLLTLTQSASGNRFIIAYTKGDDSIIKGKTGDLGGMKIPSKTFYNYAETKPDAMRIYMILQYTGLHITGKQSWRGAGKLLINNRGSADDGLANITIEVV